MNNVQKIKYLWQLESKRKHFEKELSLINKDIQEIEDNCSHINVNLGYLSDNKNVCRCLICGKKDIEESEYVIYAEDYLNDFDINNHSQCDEKFDIIQTCALGIIKKDPEMSRDEIVNRMNNLFERKTDDKDVSKQLIKK